MQKPTIVRQAKLRDLARMADVEKVACGPAAWSVEEIARAVAHPEASAIVATQGRAVVGFAIYRIDSGGLYLCDIAVHPARHRQGIGSDLVSYLAGKFFNEPIGCVVRRHLVGVGDFLRANGFYARAVIRDVDAFLFWLDRPGETRHAAAVNLQPINPPARAA